MVRSFIGSCTSTKIVVVFITIVCICLAFKLGGMGLPRLKDNRHLSVSAVRNTEPGNKRTDYKEPDYNNGWSILNDPNFVGYIRDGLLHKPSGVPPNMPARSYSQYGEDIYVKELLKDRRNGFFLEAGGLDGVRVSNTLNLELTNNWTGLLVQADPSSFGALRKKKRNVYAIHACLSANKSEILSFVRNTEGLKIAPVEDTNIYHLNEDKQRIQVQCFPLYSILLAVGRTKIDFFSFDMECAAENVLESIPIDKVDIKLFVIKYHLGDEYQKQLRLNKLLGFFDKIGGYTFVGTHQDMAAVFQKVQKES